MPYPSENECCFCPITSENEPAYVLHFEKSVCGGGGLFCQSYKALGFPHFTQSFRVLKRNKAVENTNARYLSLRLSW